MYFVVLFNINTKYKFCGLKSKLTSNKLSNNFKSNKQQYLYYFPTFKFNFSTKGYKRSKIENFKSLLVKNSLKHLLQICSILRFYHTMSSIKLYISKKFERRFNMCFCTNQLIMQLKHILLTTSTHLQLILVV